MSTWESSDDGIDGVADRPAEAQHWLAALTLDEVAEAAGELHRRIGVALRGLGELRADRPAAPRDVPEPQESARTLVARLIATHELVAICLARQIEDAEHACPDVAPSAPTPLVAALSYAAPTIPMLLARLEQDRRLLVSIGRRREELGADSAARILLRAALIEASARCAQAIETRAETEDA